MKYIPIPVNKEAPVNINKIRQMLKEKSHKGSSSIASNHLKEEQDMIENVGYFNSVNFKGVVK